MKTEEQILMSGGQVQTDTDHLGTGDADPLGLYTKHLEDAPVALTAPPGVPPASPPPLVPEKAEKGLELAQGALLGRQEPLFRAQPVPEAVRVKPVPEAVRDEPLVQQAAGELGCLALGWPWGLWGGMGYDAVRLCQAVPLGWRVAAIGRLIVGTFLEYKQSLCRLIAVLIRHKTGAARQHLHRDSWFGTPVVTLAAPLNGRVLDRSEMGPSPHLSGHCCSLPWRVPIGGDMPEALCLQAVLCSRPP